ncbi:MAG: LysM peptidoglycan-binding domain-containing protein [Thermodesulfobacteriota bacterium]|nr:LysM peptidoglycan-binding domain-containing protein [Thermodesulfobacteriota bacterium]
MKRFVLYTMMMVLFSACAWSRGDVRETQDPGMGPDSRVSTPAEKHASSIGKPLVSDKKNESMDVMSNAGDILREGIAIRSYEYAPAEFFELILAYLEMQNAYIDGDTQGLSLLNQRFDLMAKKTRRMTVGGKQRRLEQLGQEVEQRRDEIKNQGHSDIFEVYSSIHVVEKGETLPGIATRPEVYNDSFMWPLIYKANRDQIKDPKIIYQGQSLKIPRDISMDEIVEARREAGASDPEELPEDAFLPRRKK